MLLFFITQMTANANPCDTDRLHFIGYNPKVLICATGIREEVEKGITWWNNNGQNFRLADGIQTCNHEPVYGEIHIEFNDHQVATMDTETTTALGITVRNHFGSVDSIVSANIYLSAALLDDRIELQTLITHELGHAVGYQHVPEECIGYMMHPFVSKMGDKL